MEYLISYFAVGIFLACAALIHGTFPRGEVYVLYATTVLLWPILVLIAPDAFLSSGNNPDINLNHQDSLKDKLASLADVTASVLTEEERQRLIRVAKCSEENISIFSNRSNLEDVLSQFWELNVPPEVYYSFKRAHLNLDEHYDPASQPRISKHLNLDENYDPATQPKFSIAPPDWYIGFSHEFVKSIAKADSKKKARILKVLGEIAAAPMEVHGDTIKPLTGDYAGLWRCRMGDDRLVYYPDTHSKKVVLISFGARGDSYQSAVDVSTVAGGLNRSEH